MRHVIQIVIGQDYATDLRARMDAAGVSQNQLAEEMGLAANVVSRWFTQNPNRRVSPNMESVERIELALLRIMERRAKAASAAPRGKKK